ncbi:Uncharacterised protein [Shewanella baltica]|uniref:hypothetical protein n=1 Tax=Shewanella TaxID=22 RepID=UPI000F709822|nr:MULTISPECIES: hypothetical protein [Shewanella]MCB2380962.1 hypothetical protein [Shewanella sp. SR1]VEF25658.1 Uncharacterised protein [Shewanella baltica]
MYIKFILLAGMITLAGCSTTPTETSAQVTEYKSIDEMKKYATCEAIDAVNDTYDVTLHSPWGRKRAAHIRLKDAAYSRGANAVIMTSNNYGVITDQVQGVAYKCVYGGGAG